VPLGTHLTRLVGRGRVPVVRITLAVSLGTLAVLAVLGASPLGKAASSAPSGVPGRWELVSGGGIESPVGEIGHARDARGTLHVVWVRRTGGNAYDLAHTPIDLRGRLGASSNVVTGWAGLGGAGLFSDGSSLRAFFPGARTTVTGDPNFGLNEAVSTTDGTAWSVYPESVYHDQFAYARTASVVPGPDPDGLQAWYGLDGIGVHVGRNPNGPFRTGYGAAGCCNHGINIARDAATGETMLAWCTMNEAPNGVWAQRVDPATGASVGPPMRMPGSTDVSGRRICDPGQRVPIVARRGGGGFWIIAKNGAENAVLIWRVGAGTIRFASGAGNYRRVGLAVAPDGRLWGAWSTFRDAQRVHTRRSNRRADFFGAPVSARGPQSAVDAQIIELSAGGPKLDVLTTFSAVTGSALYHTQALPGLTLSAVGGRLVRLRVADAGDPVSGATVSIAGRRLRTGANGRVSVDLPRGRYTARASKPGYVGAQARVRSR